MFWLFFRVNVFAALDFPTTVAEYVAVAGVNVACASPVPDSETDCGLFEALSPIERVPVRGPVWVGVKVTLIVQLFPAAKVLPQLLVSVKLLLIATLLMYRVELELFFSVATFALLDDVTMTEPNAREPGVRLISVPLISGATVRLSGVELVVLPDTPAMVTTTVPVAAEPLAVRFNVLEEDVGFGEKVAVTPLGRPEADSVTLPLKPPPSVTVIVVVTLFPCVTNTLLGEAASVKNGPGGPARLLIRPAPFILPQPVAKS